MPSNRNNRSTGAGRQGATSRRQSSGVPPLDAFETTPKRRPPNLPGQPGFDPHAGNPGGSTRGPSRQGGGQGSATRPPGKNAPKAAGGSRGKKPRAAQPAKRRKPKRRVSPARRRRRRFLAVFCTALVLIGAGVWFSLNVLFKIEGYTVEGETVYTQEEMIQAFGFDVGENMFSFNAKTRAETMRQTLPYLEELRIRRKLPGTVVFQATPAVETYSLEYNGGFVVLSESLKVLRIAESAPEDLVQLYGLSDLTTQPGLPLVVAIGEEDDYNPYQELPQPATDKVEEPEEPPQADTPPEDGGEGSDGNTEDGENTGDDPAQGTDGTGEGATDVDSGGEDEPATPEDTGSADDEPGNTGDTTDGEEGDGEENDGENGDEPDENETQKPEDTEPVRRELATPHERMEATLELIALLEKAGVEDVGWIDVTDTLNLRFRWQGRITVVLGARSSLEEKLACAIVIMEGGGQNPVGPNEHGTVDVSAYTTTLMGYFTPE